MPLLYHLYEYGLVPVAVHVNVKLVPEHCTGFTGEIADVGSEFNVSVDPLLVELVHMLATTHV